jgi:rhodanese-related sulfurtransferase
MARPVECRIAGSRQMRGYRTPRAVAAIAITEPLSTLITDMQTLAPASFRHFMHEPDTLLLDVRMPEEVALVALPGALNIPLHELPARVGEIGRPRAIAIYCHHGVRSDQAMRWLARQGHTELAHLDGGIDAWSLQLDPLLPRY